MAGAMSLKLAKVVTKVLLGRKAAAIDVGSDGRPAFVRHVDPNSGGLRPRPKQDRLDRLTGVCFSVIARLTRARATAAPIPQLRSARQS
jgi:hypothetical protein